MDLGELVQNIALELRHALGMQSLRLVPAVERAQYVAQRVAQLAIGLDVAFQDLRSDTLIIDIIGRGYPESQYVGARLLDHILRENLITERLRHLAAVLRHGE